MVDSFSKLLLEYRREAGLNQKELAQKIHIHSSMISRFEREHSSPSPNTLQEIINTLALEGITRDKLDKLWIAAGYHRTELFDKPVADPIVVSIQQELSKLEPDKKKLLSKDLHDALEIHQGFFSAKKTIEQQNWNLAHKSLIELRGKFEDRIQGWYLRLDEEQGLCLTNLGRYTGATQYYESALWTATQLEDLTKQGELHLKLGELRRRLGGTEWKIAHTHFKEAKKIFENLKNKKRVADSLRKIANIYFHLGEPNEMLPLCDESLKISEAENYVKGYYKALQHKSWAYDMLGQWHEATVLCERALEIIEKNSMGKLEFAKAHWYLGDAYRLERKYAEAEASYKTALEYLDGTAGIESIELTLCLGMVRLGLGKTYLKQPGRKRDAQWQFNMSLEINRRLGEDFKTARVNSEQGALLVELGTKLEDAEMRLKQASNNFNRLDNVYYNAITLSVLCKLYYLVGNYKDVYKTAETAREISNTKEYLKYQLAQIELHTGQALIQEKRFDEASTAFFTASKYAVEFNEQTFGELSKDISAEIDSVAQKFNPTIAIQVSESLADNLQTYLIEAGSTQQQAIQGMLQKYQQQQLNLKTLMTIE